MKSCNEGCQGRKNVLEDESCHSTGYLVGLSADTGLASLRLLGTHGKITVRHSERKVKVHDLI